MKKITFLFGAGAEANGNYELPSGTKYILSIIRLQEELKHILPEIFTGKYYGLLDVDQPYTYRKDTVDLIKIIKRTLIKHKAKHDAQFFKGYEKEIKEELNKSEYEELKSLRKESEARKEEVETVRINADEEEEFRKILLTEGFLYENIKSDFYRELFVADKEGKIVFAYEKVISGILDSYFHTIINPNKYGVGKFARIFNFYWACYFAIVEPILEVLINSHYTEFKQYYENGKCKYKEIIENIDTFTKLLYGVQRVKTEQKTYYACIKEYLDKKEYECQGILTTNYYNFCEQIPVQEYAYLNGQLKYFEYPENLEVADLSKEKKKEGKIFFPFIFGQSHVKPIVHSVQTNSYAKMKEILDATDILVILGYGIGEDDNHINAFLHEFLNRENKKILCITEKDTEEDFVARLRMDGNIQGKIICNYEKFDNTNNENIIKNIFKRLGEI